MRRNDTRSGPFQTNHETLRYEDNHKIPFILTLQLVLGQGRRQISQCDWKSRISTLGPSLGKGRCNPEKEIIQRVPVTQQIDDDAVHWLRHRILWKVDWRTDPSVEMRAYLWKSLLWHLKTRMGWAITIRMSWSTLGSDSHVIEI